MDEVRVLMVYMKDVLNHAQYQSRNSERLAEGTDTQGGWNSNEERYGQTGEEYPPLFTPDRNNERRQNRHHAK